MPFYYFLNTWISNLLLSFMASRRRILDTYQSGMLIRWVTNPCTWPSGYLHLNEWLLGTRSSALTNWPLKLNLDCKNQQSVSIHNFFGAALDQVAHSSTQLTDSPHCLCSKLGHLCFSAHFPNFKNVSWFQNQFGYFMIEPVPDPYIFWLFVGIISTLKCQTGWKWSPSECRKRLNWEDKSIQGSVSAYKITFVQNVITIISVLTWKANLLLAFKDVLMGSWRGI